MPKGHKKGPKCGARAKSTGEPCKKGAGERTSHPGEGKCFLHGAADGSGAPEDNKNAVITGEFERLHVSALSVEEQRLYDSLSTDPQPQAEDSIRLASIREHRILIRIKRAQENTEDGFGVSSVKTEQGWDVKGKKDVTTVERTTTLDTVMRLEEALTRVQTLKARWVSVLSVILAKNPPASGGLEEMVAALDRAGAAAAARKERDLELDRATGGVLDD